MSNMTTNTHSDTNDKGAVEVPTADPVGPVSSLPARDTRRPRGNPNSRTARGRRHQPGWRPCGTSPAVVYMPSPNTVSDPEYIKMLSAGLVSLGLSRREAAQWIETMIGRFDGKVLYAGSPATVPDRHLIFMPEQDTDPDAGDKREHRWMSEFFAYSTKGREIKQATQARVIARLQVISVALQIGHPSALRSP